MQVLLNPPEVIEKSPKKKSKIEKVCVFGSRGLNDIDKIVEIVKNLLIGLNIYPKEFVSGECENSPDMANARLKIIYDCELKKFDAKWNKYGNRAGPIRNVAMASYLKNENGMAIGFWNRISTGTKGMINECRKRYIPLVVFTDINLRL